MAQMNTARRKFNGRDSISPTLSLIFALARRKLDVFLSSSPDCRYIMLTYFRAALMYFGVFPFTHSDLWLHRNLMEQSIDSIHSAIHPFKIFVVIFSQGYAHNRSCLDQLAAIAERLQKGNQGGEIVVMPVFCGVSPSDVRNQTGSFEIAFQEHQKRFDTNTVEGWKKALRVVSQLRGWYMDDGHEQVQFSKAIVTTVFSDLRNIKLRSQTAHGETRGFSASCRGNTDFGWYKLNGISFRAVTYEVSRPFHVFINHRGPDTKGNIAALLHRDLTRLRLNSFLDKRSIMLGEDLEMVIETAIRECKVGVAIISPDYCTSKNCLEELVMLMECNKKVIPIFFDTKVSDLTLKSNGSFSDEQMDRFSCALKFIKKRAGIEFNSKEDWSDMIDKVLASVMNMINKDREIKEIDYYPPHRLLC